MFMVLKSYTEIIIPSGIKKIKYISVGVYTNIRLNSEAVYFIRDAQLFREKKSCLLEERENDTSNLAVTIKLIHVVNTVTMYAHRRA